MTTKSACAVVNTSPWIALSLCGQTDLLKKLYENVLIPPAVRQEITVGGKSQVGVQELEAASWLGTVEIEDPSKVSLLHELDRGEAEVIIVAQEQRAAEVIIDEKVARMQARVLGLEVVGTLGLLLRAKKRGLIHEIAPLIDKMLQEGTYIHQDIVRGMLHEAGE